MTIFEGREPTTGPSRDRGAVLPLFALMLVVLLAFVALAVDVGQLYAERRQDQAAVDSGALSGAYQAVLSTTRTDQAIFDEVTKISYDSLDPDTRPATLTAWRALWPACTDSVGAASPIYGGNNQRINPSLGRIDCIRKSSNGTRIRVKLPTRTLNTFFARVLGVNTVSSTAVAEAGLNPVNTGVLPFAVSATGAGGDVICLKEPPNGLTPGQICPGSTQGNFGYVGSPRPSWDSNQACNGGQNTVVQQNIAQGLDHDLTEWTGTTVADQCTGVAVLGTPTAQFFQTGNIASTIEDGFITAAQESGSFADGQPARLARSSPCVVNGGVNQNGIPRTQALPQQPSKILEWCGVWDYMVPNLVQGSDPATQVPPACYQLATVGASQNLAGSEGVLRRLRGGWLHLAALHGESPHGQPLRMDPRVDRRHRDAQPASAVPHPAVPGHLRADALLPADGLRPGPGAARMQRQLQPVRFGDRVAVRLQHAAGADPHAVLRQQHRELDRPPQVAHRDQRTLPHRPGWRGSPGVGARDPPAVSPA